MSKWPMVPLGQICEILDSRRKPITKSERVSGKVPYYGASGVQDHVEGHLFDEPLVLLGEDGAKWGAGDPSAFMIAGKSWVNNHAHVLRPNRDLLLDEWLAHYLISADLTEYISGATVPKLNQARMREIPIPLPPLDEQKRIVSKLEAVSQQDLAWTSLIEAKQQLALSLVDRAFASILETHLSRAVSNDRVDLAHICKVDWGNTNLTKSSYEADGRYLAVSAAGPDGRIGHAEHPAFTPVLSAIGARCGRMFLPREDFTAIKNTITLTPIEGLTYGPFLYYLFRSIRLPIRGAGQPFIAKGDIESFQVQIPSLSDQHQIAATCEQVEQLVSNMLDRWHLADQAFADFMASLKERVLNGDLS